MTTLQSLDLSLVSLLILIFMFLSAFSRLERIFVHYNLFISLIVANMVLIVVDILGWAFNGLPGVSNLLLNKLFNLLLYILIPAAPSVWVLYVDYHVFRDEERLRKYLYVLIPLWAANAAVSFISLRTGWFFGVTPGNIYYRGENFWYHAGFSYALLIYSFFLVLFNRKRIERKYYFALQTYLIPQVIGSALQVIFYGVSYTWVGMMLSLLLIYSNIQNSALNTDHLTGIYNRSHLEAYIRARIRRNAKNGSFSAIFLDLDGFKEINDAYGHHIGDEAIRDAADILRKSIRQNDFAARIGGDEFVAVLNGPDRDILRQTVERIEEYASDFNRAGMKPYKLSFSIGYDIYDAGKYSGPEDFLKTLDRMMYRDKQNKRREPFEITKGL